MAHGPPTALERYGRGVEQCRANAKLAQHAEIAELWSSIAASYLFLLEREQRLVAEEAERDGRFQLLA